MKLMQNCWTTQNTSTLVPIKTADLTFFMSENWLSSSKKHSIPHCAIYDAVASGIKPKNSHFLSPPQTRMDRCTMVPLGTGRHVFPLLPLTLYIKSTKISLTSVRPKHSVKRCSAVSSLQLENIHPTLVPGILHLSESNTSTSHLRKR